MPGHWQVQEIPSPLQQCAVSCDIEQFGMRHRSVLKLCASIPGAAAFVLSQDGGVALVWAAEKKVIAANSSSRPSMPLPFGAECIKDLGEPLHLML